MFGPKLKFYTGSHFRRLLMVTSTSSLLLGSLLVQRVNSDENAVLINSQGEATRILGPGFHFTMPWKELPVRVKNNYQFSQHELRAVTAEGNEIGCTVSLTVRPKNPAKAIEHIGEHWIDVRCPNALDKTAPIFARRTSLSLFPLSRKNQEVEALRLELESSVAATLSQHEIEVASLHVDAIDFGDELWAEQVAQVSAVLPDAGSVAQVIREWEEEAANYLCGNESQRWRTVTAEAREHYRLSDPISAWLFSPER